MIKVSKNSIQAIINSKLNIKRKCQQKSTSNYSAILSPAPLVSTPPISLQAYSINACTFNPIISIKKPYISSDPNAAP